jgi:proline racemase
MPLPSSTDLAKMDIAYLGQPFVQVEAKALDTVTLDVAYLGQPFVAVGPSVVPPAGTRYILIT